MPNRETEISQGQKGGAAPLEIFATGDGSTINGTHLPVRADVLDGVLALARIANCVVEHRVSGHHIISFPGGSVMEVSVEGRGGGNRIATFEIEDPNQVKVIGDPHDYLSAADRQKEAEMDKDAPQTNKSDGNNIDRHFEPVPEDESWKIGEPPRGDRPYNPADLGNPLVPVLLSPSNQPANGTARQNDMVISSQRQAPSIDIERHVLADLHHAAQRLLQELKLTAPPELLKAFVERRIQPFVDELTITDPKRIKFSDDQV